VSERRRQTLSGLSLDGRVAALSVPVVSEFLALRPLHGADGAMVVAAFAVVVLITFALTSQLRRRPD
jgi:hypothetical protein